MWHQHWGWLTSTSSCTPSRQLKEKKNHHCTPRVLVRASSHVLYLLSIVESTEPRQVYGVKLDLVSERTIKDHDHHKSESPACLETWYIWTLLLVYFAHWMGSVWSDRLCPVLVWHDSLCPVLVWRGRYGLGGLVLLFMLGSNMDRVGPERGLRGGGRRGWCEEWARSC